MSVIVILVTLLSPGAARCTVPGVETVAEGEADCLPRDYPGSGLLINVPAASLVLVSQGRVQQRYPIAVGRPGRETPVGDFHITDLIPDPWWYPEGRPPVPPGPDNPLGSWWFGLSEPGYGIHGTNDEASIGGFVSDGCVRLREADAARLAEELRAGIPVRIVGADAHLLPQITEEDEVSWNLGVYPDRYGAGESSGYEEVRDYLRSEDRILSYMNRERLAAALRNGNLPVEIPVVTTSEPPGLEHFGEEVPLSLGESGHASHLLVLDERRYLPLGAVVHAINEDLEQKWGYVLRCGDGRDLIPAPGGFPEIMAEYGPRKVYVHRFAEEPPVGALRGVFLAGEIYVPQDQLQNVLPVSSAGDGHWHHLGWRTLRFGASTVAVYPHADNGEPHCIPVTELDMLFGPNLDWCARREEITLFGHHLRDVLWCDDGVHEETRPWLSPSEVARILNMTVSIDAEYGVSIGR